MNTNISILLPLNLVNILIVSHFFKTHIRKKLITKKTTNNINKIPSTTNKTNLKYINQAKNINSIVQEQGSINKSKNKPIIDEILNTKLDNNANICPPIDYNINDNTCKNCEWLKNCLTRYTKENIQT